MGALAAACTGVIGGDPPLATSTAPLCTKPVPGPAPLRRLTQSQYDNVVRDLLGDTSQPAHTFPTDTTVGEFSNNATTLVVSPLLAQAYEAAAEALSGVAITDPKLLPCSPTVVGEDACARAFIATFGKRAFRRPLSKAESDMLFQLYTDNRMGADFNNGIRAIIELALQSAPFLYQVEAGDAAKVTDGVVPLTSWEMASRLSFFLWNSMPDDALFAAAEADELQTPEQIEAQARRMLGSPKAHDATTEFFSQWLHLDGLFTATKDPTLYPQYTDAMRTSMQAETLAFTDWVMWQSDGRVQTLLTAPVSFLDANTAPLYGKSMDPASKPTKTDLDPKERAGILTQPSVMSVFAKPNQSSPVTRGKWVRERLLCQRVPPPPPNLNIIPPEVKSGESTRQRFAQHDADPYCAGCHKLMDPIGFGFEHYDAVGRWRDVDQGQPVDATGVLSVTDVNGPFDGAPALAATLANSKEVTDCVSIEWFRYAFGSGETTDDECSLGSVKEAFAKGNYDMKELLVAMTRTAAFRYRPVVKP
jgi:hypothetical protein